MTRDELKSRIAAVKLSRGSQILEDICSAIFEGRAMMTSSEILDTICDTLKEAGLDDGGEWPPTEDDE